MRATVSLRRLRIDKVLYDFVNHEALPGTGIQPESCWSGFSALVERLAPRNAALLRRRDELQSQIDAWHRENPGAAFDQARYKEHLVEIGYIVPEREPLTVDTADARPGNRPHRRSSAGRAGQQLLASIISAPAAVLCSVCAEAERGSRHRGGNNKMNSLAAKYIKGQPRFRCTTDPDVSAESIPLRASHSRCQSTSKPPCVTSSRFVRRRCSPHPWSWSPTQDCRGGA